MQLLSNLLCSSIHLQGQVYHYLSFIITIIFIIIVFSGVLAVAVAGLVVASMSGPVILNKKSMDDVWMWIEWIGNTLIFLLAGLITGHKVLKSIYGRDWLILFCLYLIVNICRFATVGFFWPLLKRFGYGLTPKEAVFIRYHCYHYHYYYLLVYECNCLLSYNINCFE